MAQRRTAAAPKPPKTERGDEAAVEPALDEAPVAVSRPVTTLHDHDEEW